MPHRHDLLRQLPLHVEPMIGRGALGALMLVAVACKPSSPTSPSGASVCSEAPEALGHARMLVPETVVLGDPVTIEMAELSVSENLRADAMLIRPDGKVTSHKVLATAPFEQQRFMGCDPVPGVPDSCPPKPAKMDTIPASMGPLWLDATDLPVAGRYTVVICGPMNVSSETFMVVPPG